jgi:hypothetical protein
VGAEGVVLGELVGRTDGDVVGAGVGVGEVGAGELEESEGVPGVEPDGVPLGVPTGVGVADGDPAAELGSGPVGLGPVGSGTGVPVASGG